MHFKECFNVVFYAIVWISELDCTFHYMFDKRKKWLETMMRCGSAL